MAMHIEHIPPGQLKPSDSNARTHTIKQISQIMRSFEEFGINTPVALDDQGHIICGHGRVAAALKLGLATVPCIRLSHLTKAQQRAYAIADNQLALKAGWDREVLAIEMQGLIDIGFDVTMTGFEIAEVDLALEEYRDKQSDDEEAPIPEVGPPVTRAGEVWEMGKHRLACGDARDAGVYDVLMGDEQAAMMFADPPYNVNIDGFVAGKGRIKHREFAMAAGEMSKPEYSVFLEQTLRPAADHSADGAIHFVCMDWRHMSELTRAGEAVYSELKNVIVWVKDNAGMGTFYRSQHELIFAYKNGRGAHTNTFELGQHGRSRSNVWKYAGVNSFKAGRMEELASHPTVKPLPLVADALKDCSKRGDIVLDPFCGSGTTIIAAEKTGRRARAIELDPGYCDVAIRRWQAFTGKRAELQATGESFEVVEEERAASGAPA